MEGAANEAILELIAGALDLPRGAITLISGEHARTKRFRIEGLSLPDIRARLRLPG